MNGARIDMFALNENYMRNIFLVGKANGVRE
jgi:hypothetical protein